MTKHKITLLPGDGIGPEVTAAVVQIIECAGVEVEWEKYVAGAEALARFGDPLPQEVLDSIIRNRVALKGPVTTPVGTGFASINVRLRKTLDLYSNLRPVRSMPNIITRYENVDLIVVRENTEDLYSGIEHEVVPGVIESIKVITEKASTRIARFAFEYARSHGRRRVTAVHKANIMKMSDGLFLQCFRNVAKDYPNIEADDRIVDNLCMQLVMNPTQFDILLLENLYGDIVSDLCAGLVGGLGVVGAANLGTDVGVFEAVHGSAPDIAGKNYANPTALLLSAVLMLRHIDEGAAADRIMTALSRVLEDGTARTRDLGGTTSTFAFADAVCRAMV
jgi:isocitrate dehydrogenase (NAD+)